MQLSHFPLVPGDRRALRPDIVLALIAHVDVAIVLSGIASGQLLLILRIVPLGVVTALLKGLFFEEHNVVLPIWHLLTKHGRFRVLEATIVAIASGLNTLVYHVLNAIKIDPGRLLLQAD
jgi:hypothetical protein